MAEDAKRDEADRNKADTAALWNSALRHFDAVRRWRGMAMDGLGIGRNETDFKTLVTEAGFRLRLYEPAAPDCPALLIVPAPIKRGYIWDLQPHASVVRACQNAGFRVYMVDWVEPGEAERDFALAEYGDRLILRCVDAIREAGDGDKVFITGHSLGGTLAALFASLYADRVRGLALIESPLHFGPDTGSFAPVVAGAPHAATLREAFGNIPGTFLNLVSVNASPQEFNWQRRLDWIASLGNPQAFQTHLAVERWTLDEFPIPGKLFEELIELLYREDRFARGTLTIGGRPASPQGLTCPLLAVVAPEGQVIPPATTLPVIEAAPATNKLVLDYGGDIGVALQHVGPLVGRSAHETLWPQIIGWLKGIITSDGVSKGGD